MRYIINFNSHVVNNKTTWSGGVAPVRNIGGKPPRALAMSEAYLSENKTDIIDGIVRTFKNENFIANQITYGKTRIGSVDELIEILEQVE